MNPNKRWLAESGDNSRKFQILGKPGEDLIIKAPLGTTLLTDNKSVIGKQTCFFY